MVKTFADQLRAYGPESRFETPSLSAARAYCRRLALSHYENFTVASFLLPRKLLQHIHSIYAYCRWADDLGDETGGGTRALALLSWWRDELLHCYEGRPRHPVMVALSDTIGRFAIPAQPFLDLLSAFEQDQHMKCYRTYEQLLDYCKRSANPVGRLVLYLFEAFDPERAVLSDHICTALQLTNFWQDVARDLDIGRVYIPEEDRAQFGYADRDLHERRCTPAFVELMRFEVERTRELFRRGAPLARHAPGEFRQDIELFMRGGLAILDRIERQGYDVWRQRPVLPKWQKGWLLLGALGRYWTEFAVPWASAQTV